MKCYHVLACDVLAEIQQQTLDYLATSTTFLTEKPQQPWQTVDTKSVFSAVPSLLVWLRNKRLLPHEVSFIVYHNTGIGLPIHTDDPQLISKVNIPIQNTEGNITRWHADDDSVIAEYDMTQPVVFNSSIPHSVEIRNKNLPRIIMAVMIKNEKSLLELLAD
jgi:hypothetical protein